MEALEKQKIDIFPKQLGWFDEQQLAYSRLDYLSHAKLSKLYESPKTFEWTYIKQKPQKSPTPAVRLGNLIDWALLNPKEFRRRAKVEPDVKRNTIVGKAEYQKFTDSLLPDALIVEPEHHLKIMEMIQSVSEATFILDDGIIRPVSSLLWPKGGKYDQWGYFKVPETDLTGLIRPDVIVHEHDLIVELKTGGDISRDKFAGQIKDLNYHMQAAWYTMGAKELSGGRKHKHFFVAIETTEPYHVEVYPTHPDTIHCGIADVKTAIERFQMCSKTGRWYGYQERTSPINMKPWAFAHLEENQ